MYNPTSRVLTVLELLQSRPSISGPELAARLEMDVRSVRRYITILQDAGIPIEATIGRHGGYRLRPGFKLPPLLFSDEEATAIVLSLLGTSWLEIGQSPVAVEGALAKVLRVLPLRVRERLSAVSTHLILSPHQQDARPDASLLIELSDAIEQRRRIAIDYRAQDNTVSQRAVEPYSVVGWWGRWYLVAYCRLRRGYRLFRLDRVQTVQALEQHFARSEDFDCEAYVREHLGKLAPHWQIEIEFQAPLETVQQRIPASYGTLTATPAGALFRSQYGDMADTARYLIGLNLPFVVHQPQELRDTLLEIGERMIRGATAHRPPSA
jgi:predicted DNA-binding transcriptional regulator YafY